MKTWFYLFLLGVAFVACKEQEIISSPVRQYPENRPVPEKIEIEENVTILEEQVRWTHGSDIMRYCVIVGSFVNEQNALDLRNSLIGMGYDKSCIMQNMQGMFRVAAVCSDNEAAARTQLLKIRRSSPQFKDAWLLMPK